MPIRLRLATLCTFLVLAVLGAGGAVFFRVLDGDLLRQLDDELRARAADVAAQLQAGRPPAVVAGSAVGPQDIFVQVTAPDGRVLASSGVAVAAPVLSLARLRSAAATDTPLEHAIDASPTGGASSDRLRLVAVTGGVRGVGFVVAGATLDPVDDALRDVLRELLITGVVVTVLAASGAWALAGAALRPVERLRRDVARISERDVAPRVEPPRTRDELAALAATMNGLLGRLQTALSRQRRLVADAAHELRTPLSVLRTELELAGRPGRSHEQLTEAVAAAAQETDRLVRLAEDLLFLARTDEGVPMLRPEPLIVAEVLEEAVAAYAVQAAASDVAVRVAAPDDLVAVLDEARIRQAVENLVDNAVRMAPPGTGVRVEAHAEDGMAVIAVSDRGPGFPPGFIEHAFERFRRADPARDRRGGGTGLGLAIVDAIAQAHGGRAEAHNRPEGGATVTLSIPVRGPEEDDHR